MAQKQKMIRIVVGLVVVIAGIYAVFFIDWKKEPVEAAPSVRPLKMITVGRSVSGQVRKYPGKVAAIDRVALGFQVDGPLIEFPLRKGQKVKKGDLLARIDPRDFQNRFDSYKAQLEQATTQLDRIKKATESGAVSQTDLTNAQAAFEQAQADFSMAKKALEDTSLLAPFDGYVANIFVDNFQNVQAKEPIVTVQKMEDVLIEVNVPEERILQATKKNSERYRFEAVFDSLPKEKFDAKLYEYSLEADPLTQTYLITFSMPMQDPNKFNVLPGMTTTILEYPLETDQQVKVFLLPIEAVPVDGSGQYFVWKVEKDNGDLYSVHRQNVQVDEIEGNSIQILSGLSQGDTIAANGVHLLQEGQKVSKFTPKGEESAR